MRSIEAPQQFRLEIKKDSSELLSKIHQAELRDDMKDLPIVKEQERIKENFRRFDKLIVQAGTGTGKSRALPLVLYDEILKQYSDGKRQGKPGRIVITQPNQILTGEAAGNLATLVGEENVGYRHKGVDTTKKQTTPFEINVEQTLLNSLIKDEYLTGVDVVVLDEIHRRNKILDLIVPLLQKTQRLREKQGKPIKIVYTSATLDHEKMLEYLDNAEHVEIEGRPHKINQNFSEMPIDSNDVEGLIRRAAEKTVELYKSGGDPGETLTFLPGKKEIEQYKQLVEQLLQGENIEIVVLMGGQNREGNKEKIKNKTDKNRIFAVTNVVQEGITLPAVTNVIDLGIEKMQIYDEATGRSSLQTVESTKSSCRQRWGRAGRVQEGHAYMMYSQAQFEARPEFLKPEVLRSDISDLILTMKSKDVGITDVENFNFIDHPGKERIQIAVQKLQRLGALNADGSISNIGEEMLELNLEPQFARMVVEAKRLGVMNEVGTLIGIMQSHKSLLTQRNARIPQHYIVKNSDILTLANIWNDYLQNSGSDEQRSSWQQSTEINPSKLYDGSSLRREISTERSKDMPIDISSEEIRDKIARSLTVGFVDNFLQKGHLHYKTLTGPYRNYAVGRESSLYGRDPKSFIAGEIRKGRGDQSYTSYNFEITLEQLLNYAPYLSGILNQEIKNTEINESLTVHQPTIPPENTIQNHTPQETHNNSQNSNHEPSNNHSHNSHAEINTHKNEHNTNTRPVSHDVGKIHHDTNNVHSNNHSNHHMPWNEPFYVKLLKAPYKFGKSIFDIPKNMKKFFKNMIREVRGTKL